MKKIKVFSSFVTIIALILLTTAPAFAQLGDTTPPPTPPAETTPPTVTTAPPVATPPATDLCPNIDGVQASIPTGMMVDGSGNCVTISVTPPADTTAPIISGVAEASLLPTEATILWSTDELATSTLQYGTTTSYGRNATFDGSALLVHAAVLTGLTAGTTYHYCIHATDLAGNASNSCGHLFSTTANTIIAEMNLPIISSASVGAITTTNATIAWTTNQVSNSQIEYGTTAGYGSTATLNTNFSLVHSEALSNLTPNTTYHYRIKTANTEGNTTYGPDETFTTDAIAQVTPTVTHDTTAPVISGVGNTSLGLTDGTIVWNTNELAVSTLQYGTTTNYGSSATLPLTGLLEHSATLTGLSQGMTYYYCIHATDVAGNTANSCGHTLTTTSAPTPTVPVTPPMVPSDTTAPIISLIASSSTTATGTAIAWTTNELANSQVEFGTTISYGSTTTLDTSLSLIHNQTLADLEPNTTYHYRILATDRSNNLAVSADDTFTTSAVPETPSVTVTPPTNTSVSAVITNIEVADLTDATATITWNTDLPSNSQIAYGDSSLLGSATPVDSTLTTSHSVTISGLTQNTNYYFVVKSQPVGSNAIITLSAQREFNTLADQDPIITPANILSVASSGVTPSSATVSTATDKPTSVEVQYGTTTSYGQATTADASQTSHSIALTNLEPATTYDYRIKATDADGNITYSENYTLLTISSSGASTPSVTSVPSAVTTLPSESSNNQEINNPIVINASGENNQISFDFNNVQSNGSDQTVIVENSTNYPTSPSDGQVVYEGNASTFTDTNAMNGTIRYYAIYSRGSGGGYSGGVLISLAANAANNQFQINQVPSLTMTTPNLHFVQELTKGSKDIEVEHLQTILSRDEGAYPASVIDGKFGPLTEKAVIAFQKKYSLPVTGTTNAPTQQKLNEIALSHATLAVPTDLALVENDLKPGDRTDNVSDLQEFLTTEMSFPSTIQPNGFYGVATKAAVKLFQTKHNIKPDGVFGPQTRHKVQELTGL